MKQILTYLFICSIISLKAQQFQSRSLYEKKWAITHPFAAIKVKRIYKKALPLYKTIQQSSAIDKYNNGGKLDAFRHVFFMAAFAQKIKPKKILKLGIAHEKGNYINFKKAISEDGELADSLSTVMDLQNNYTGIGIGVKNKKKQLNELAGICIAAIKAGNAVYFKRSNNGEYLTCNDEMIDLSAYKNKWYIPKCLINTNE